MILAEKIISLRKKCGWSQEELAEKLNVSRQSVSKWEGAQSVPDISKIILMAETFGVSTDYLLKDELGEEEAYPVLTGEVVDTDPAEDVVYVSMEEANHFLAVNKEAAKRIAIGVSLCILSPILCILLAAAGELPATSFTENQGGIVGTIILLIIIAGAVALFVLSGFATSKYDYLEKKMIETQYGVSGMVREKKQAYEHTRMISLTVGILLCVLAVVPVLFGALLNEKDEFLMAKCVCVMLAIIAVGVFPIVNSSIIWGGFQRLLEEGDYSRENKNHFRTMVLSGYWCIITAIYLAYSFITMKWNRSWIIWPVAGV
ncbi:MAG: helix-turn-helix transcriptional regulator, partial [Blautia sp.]|nr:helix-turn-helix transcriptional regulator [Blautia sp.]